MRFMNAVLEECASCNKSMTDIPTHIDSSATEKDASFTYNDGKGIKDTVMINGPLSKAYTSALNLAFKKTPLVETANEEPTLNDAVQEEAEERDPMLRQNQKENLVVGSESAQQQSEEEFFLRELDRNSKELGFLANNFDFVKPEMLPHNVVCNTTIFTVGKLLAPENLFFFSEKKANEYVDNVILIVSDVNGRTASNTTKSRFINIEVKNDFFDEIDQENDFKAVTEGYIEPNGYKIVFGVEAYIEHLKALRKSLDGK